MDYINTWINGSKWKPASWTVYHQSVRTNNDVEGWHHRMNRKAQKPNLQLYILIVLQQLASWPEKWASQVAPQDNSPTMI